MTPEKAREILTPWRDKVGLYCTGQYICIHEGSDYGCLDGDFTVEELEAIVFWMRKPKTVFPDGVKP